MKLSLPSGKINLKMFSALIAAVILLAVVTVAYADSTGQLSPIPGLGRLPNETLIRMHIKEGSWFTDQETIFIKANALSSNFSKLIAAEKLKGRDTTALSNALAAFDDDIAAARAIHTEAGTIIYSADGWTGTGAVRDRLAAGQSLLNGRVALRDCNFRLTNGMDVLQRAFWQWRGAIIAIKHTPQPTPTP